MSAFSSKIMETPLMSYCNQHWLCRIFSVALGNVAHRGNFHYLHNKGTDIQPSLSRNNKEK